MTTSKPAEMAEGAEVEGDPHRPQYHFLPPSGWMNDPNGLIQWKGRYHLFYQHNPHGAWHDTIHWGHAVSDDLVHWTDLPIALAPTPGSPDEDGCYSGCAVGHGGIPTVLYTGVQGERQLPCLATGDDDLLTWQKYPGNPLISDPPAEEDVVLFRDHAAWNEVGVWYQLIGASIRNRGGAALLFRSDDLLHWEYLHPLHTGDKDRLHPFWTGTMWECPDFFALCERFLLLVSVNDVGRLIHTIYFLGDYEHHRLLPQAEGLLDLGDCFYAPQSLKDNQGRRILFGWVQERRSLEAQRASGWSGVMSLPRILSLSPAGTLAMAPAPEMQMLRGARYQIGDRTIDPGEPQLLEGVQGTSLEIIADFEVGESELLGVAVCCSPRGEEETRVLYDGRDGRLGIDTLHSSQRADRVAAVRWGALSLPRPDHCRLHIFLDHSVVEVFIDDVACLTARIYPSRPDSRGIALFAEGGSARLRSLQIWEMHSIWNGGRFKGPNEPERSMVQEST